MTSAISFSVCHAITISSELASCHGFLVCLKVEIDEKTKVNREQEAAKHSRVFCTSATSYVREGIWEIFSSGMFVGSKVHNENVYDELRNLHRGQIFLPPDSGTTSGGIVIVIHDDMHRQVENDYSPRDTSLAIQLRIAE